MSASHYVFKESVYTRDITEDEYRKSKGLCPRNQIRCYPDPTLIKVWDLVDGDLSKVGIDGKDTYRKDLRKSVSIRNRFTMEVPNFLKNLFKKVKLGVGSKHIYVKGDFMRKHRDARLPDLDGLPHLMTLVVLPDSYDHKKYYSGGELYINDVDVVKEFFKSGNRYDDSYGNTMVLFPITSVHEVKEITSGERHTFVFPVYGEFDPFHCIKRQVGTSTTYTTIYDEILDDIDDITQTDCSETRGHFLGKLEALGDRSLCRRFVEYRIKQGDYIPSEHCHGIDPYDRQSDSEDDSEDAPVFVTRIEYTIDDQRVVVQTNEEHKIPDGAVSIVINASLATSSVDDTQKEPTVRLPRALKNIKEEILRKKKRFTDSIEANLIAAKTQDCKLHAGDLPDGPFAYVAKNLYYSDTKEDQLLGVDAYVLQLAKQSNRDVHVSMTDISKFVQRSSVIKAFYATPDNSKLLQFAQVNEIPNSNFITGLYTEHDDQGGYDPRFTRLHCVILIGGQKNE